MDPLYLSLASMSALELRNAMLAGDLSPIDLMAHTLDTLKSANSELNAFVCVTDEQAMQSADLADQAIRAGRGTGQLVGLPVSVKDLIDVNGEHTRFGSNTQVHYKATADAPCVERLHKEMACIVGKTTTSEFGCKPVGDSPLTGVTRNPWDLGKTAGGSSAGAASSVAAGITPFAIGTDGGGSVRIPASFCGLVGIKPQFGRVPIYPQSATPNLAHVGVLTRTVRDAALLLSALAGPDPRDSNCISAPALDYLRDCEESVKGLRIAWSPTLGYATPSQEVLTCCEQAVDVFRQLGCTVTQVDKVMKDPYPHWNAEFYAGVAERLNTQLDAEFNALDPAVADCLLIARDRTADDYYYHVVQRRALTEHINTFFDQYDLLLTPTVPVTAIEAGLNTPITHTEHDIFSWVSYTYPFNLTGQPAGSIPCGMSAEGLPIGLQIVSRHFCENDIFRAAAAYEAVQPWIQYTPPHFRTHP